jgi:hypothetical protein
VIRITIVALNVLLVSCVTVAPVVNPNSEISVYGVSSLPPQNGDWTLLTASGYQVSLAKEGSKKNESLVANISIYQLPEFATDKEFLGHVTQGRAAEPNIGRFEIEKNDEVLSALNGVDCVKYHSISKDKAARVQGGGITTMLLENIGYNCKHPKNHMVGVNIEYSIRHYPETNYSSFEVDAANFFNNVEFTEF